MSRARSIWLVGALSSGGALTVGAQPTGLPFADLAWLAGIGFAVPALASTARRGPALWAAAVLVLASLGTLGPGVFAIAATVLTMVAHADGRDRFRLAAIGAFAVQAALRLPDPASMPLASAVVGPLALAPLMISGANGLDTRSRHLVRVVSITGAVAVAMACVLYGANALKARTDVLVAIEQIERASTAVGTGDTPSATAGVERAERAMRAAAGRLDPTWARPLRAVPIVGPNLRAAGVLSGQGSDLLGRALVLADDAAGVEAAVAGGAIDLDSVAAVGDSLSDLSLALEDTRATLDGVSSTWLAPPLADAVERVRDETTRAIDTTEEAHRVVDVLPGALGGSTPAHYFVILATPAETRFFGGFMGAYALLRVDQGRLDIVRSGSNTEFDDPTGSLDRSLSGEPEFLARYADRYSPDRFPKNLTASPDLPTIARVTRELAPQLGIDEPLAGVIYLDPVAIAALVQLSDREITIPGRDRSIDGTSTADFLLREQYVLFDGGEYEERKNMLQEVLGKTVTRILDSDLPSPRTIGRTLGPVAERGHLSLHSFDPAVQALVDDAGWSGAFPDRNGGDLLSIRTANANANKIDTFLERSVHYAVSLEESEITAEVSVALTSTAPTSGLPPSVIGNINGDPPGSNRLQLSLYSPWRRESSTLDGLWLDMEETRELGLWVYSAAVVVPAGERRTLRLALAGTRVASTPYHLTIAEQILSRADEVSTSVTDKGDLIHVGVLPSDRGPVSRIVPVPSKPD